MTETASPPRTLKLPCLRAHQPGGDVYVFFIESYLLDLVASVNRVQRHADLTGYQRPEVVAHVREILAYLRTPDALLPNAVIVAFDERAVFDEATNTLNVAIDPERPSGWVVDGQQRAAAFRDVEDDSFPVPVVAFVAPDEQRQREQFVLVNSAKPLPKDLVDELVVGTSVLLPPRMENRRVPTTLTVYLATREDSPLYGNMRLRTRPDGNFNSAAFIPLIRDSMRDGVLYLLRGADGEYDLERCYDLLCAYWGAVCDVFPVETQLPGRKSRLTHTAGTRALGVLFDDMSYTLGFDAHGSPLPTREQYAELLRLIVPACQWTSGVWRFGPDDVVGWNRVQSNSAHIKMLTDYLVGAFSAAYSRR